MRNLLFGVMIGYLFQDVIDDVLGRSNLVKPGASGPVAYQSFSSSGKPYRKKLSPERQAEIDAATVENPVTITWDDLEALNLNFVKVGIRGGHFKLENIEEVNS